MVKGDGASTDSIKKDRVVKLSALDNLVYKGIYNQLLSGSTNNPFSDHFHVMINESMTMSHVLSEQLNQIQDSPLFTSSELGKQMQTVFKLIASQNDMNQKRQIFL